MNKTLVSDWVYFKPINENANNNLLSIPLIPAMRDEGRMVFAPKSVVLRMFNRTRKHLGWLDLNRKKCELSKDSYTYRFVFHTFDPYSRKNWYFYLPNEVFCYMVDSIRVLRPKLCENDPLLWSSGMRKRFYAHVDYEKIMNSALGLESSGN